MTIPRTSSRADAPPPHDLNTRNRVRGGTCAGDASLPASLARFFDTLGIADEPAWRGPQDGECPF